MLAMRRFPALCVRMTVLIAAATCAVAVVVGVPWVSADATATPSIKDVMKRDIKGDNSLPKRVIAGKATPDDITKLLADFKFLAGEKAPVGDQQDWHDRTAKLVAATEAIQGGDKTPEALNTFKAAVSCKACHDLHKQKK